MIEEFSKLISDKSKNIKEEIPKLFEEQGIILSGPEVQTMKTPENQKAAERIVNAAYMNRKIIQFYRNPVLSNLEENKEIIPFVIQAIDTPGNKLRNELIKANPEITMKQVKKHLQEVMENKKSIWMNNWIAVPLATIVVFFLAHFIHLFLSYLRS